MAKSVDTLLLGSIKERCKQKQQDWFVSTYKEIGTSKTALDDLRTALAQTRRRVGTEPFVIPDGFPKIGGWQLPLEMWETAEAARVLLILKALKKQDVEARASIIDTLYEEGDERVKAAIVSGLMLLDKKGDLKFIAMKALESDERFVFTALAWGNPYAAQFFTDEEYNEMIMKTLGLVLDISPVEGVLKRRNKTLKGLALALLKDNLETLDAIPQSIWLIIAGFTNDEDNNLMLDFLSHSDAKHRFYVASSLASLKKIPPLFHPKIKQRATSESEERVKNTLVELVARIV